LKKTPCIRQLYPPTDAMKQRKAKLGLQLGNRGTDGRLRDVQLLSGSAEV
jgi:hypothetical protein